jgi:hypothetical protein
MREHKSYYTLPEIANWDEEQKVSLPTVQRGFVWKPSQIENLWDSLLRGYPVGAFVLSEAENNTFHILDGQQRATAICLGFAKETFRDSQEYYKVFIDLVPPQADDSRKYSFRVITKSHPWGYRWLENTKTLTAENIRKSMDIYEDVSDPLNASLDKFYPYEADLPVPLHYFLNAAITNPSMQESELIMKIKADYNHWPIIARNWKEENAESLSQLNESEIENKIDAKIMNIYKAVQEILHPITGQKIPALYMQLDKVINAEDPEAEDASDEVENLFVRLNSGGTQLSGEELNYSILKAHLQREVQDEIENACKQLFKPARFITIAYRLYQQENKDEKQSDALTMRIKPKQFQRTISKKAKGFETYILKLIRNKDFEENTLLEYVQSVLEYNASKQKHYGLPFLIYSKIADIAPELMFLLLYRIKFKNDRFSDKDEEAENEHRTMLGMLTLFMWFGKGENLKDHAKLLSNIWPAASILDRQRFWSSETVDRAYLNDVLLPFPAFKSNKHENGLEKIWDYNLSEKTNVLNRFENEAGEEYRLFLQKVIYNRDLILYAQRHFIESYFRQQQYRLEDTSLPFDWDHISPNNFVRSKKNIPRIVKDWYQTNGNYRAWPYALNRMDSDKSPAYKLNPLETYEDEVNFTAFEQKWQQFIDRNRNLISNKNQIAKRLTEWSYCEKEWAECFVSNIRTEWKPVTGLIIYRNFELIKEWYQQLNLEVLRKENHTTIEDLFDNRKWSLLPLKNEAYDQEFDLDEYVNRISSAFTIGSISMNFFIVYPDGENGHLEENEIEFGLFELEGNGYIKRMKNKTDFEIDTSYFKWISKSFTLVSGHLNSYRVLVNEMADWIRKLPVSHSDKELIINEFREMLSSKFKQAIR